MSYDKPELAIRPKDQLISHNKEKSASTLEETLAYKDGFQEGINLQGAILVGSCEHFDVTESALSCASELFSDIEEGNVILEENGYALSMSEHALEHKNYHVDSDEVVYSYAELEGRLLSRERIDIQDPTHADVGIKVMFYEEELTDQDSVVDAALEFYQAFAEPCDSEVKADFLVDANLDERLEFTERAIKDGDYVVLAKGDERFEGF